jgi:hypothetical protein
VINVTLGRFPASATPVHFSLPQLATNCYLKEEGGGSGRGLAP